MKQLDLFQQAQDLPLFNVADEAKVAVTNHTVMYDGKTIDMGYIGSNQKEQFKYGCMRIVDNSPEGYIKTPKGEFYYVSRSNKKAIKLSPAEAWRQINAVTLHRNRVTGTVIKAPSWTTEYMRNTARHAVNSFSFLLPFNQDVDGKDFARMIREYSTSEQATECAKVFES